MLVWMRTWRFMLANSVNSRPQMRHLCSFTPYRARTWEVKINLLFKFSLENVKLWTETQHHMCQTPDQIWSHKWSFQDNSCVIQYYQSNQSSFICVLPNSMWKVDLISRSTHKMQRQVFINIFNNLLMLPLPTHSGTTAPLRTFVILIWVWYPSSMMFNVQIFCIVQCKNIEWTMFIQHVQ